MKSVLFPGILVCLLSLSCKKNDNRNVVPPFSEARYSIEFTGKWEAPAFTVTSGVHFTTVLGMVHNKGTYLWKENELATKGVENVAEAGNPNPLLSDIDSLIANGRSISLIVMTAPSLTGASNASIYCNTNYSYVSLETMIAPTPDWFTGISAFNLYQHNKWVADTVISLYPFDAGTEDGDVFGYNNPETVPQQKIHLLQPAQATVLANGNAVFAPIASVRFIKQ